MLDGWRSRIWRHLRDATENPDLWREIPKLMAGRYVIVAKVESHMQPDDIAKGYGSEFMRRGNDEADALASKAALEASPGVGAVRRVKGLRKRPS